MAPTVKKIGPYPVVRELARGGYGAVYLARDPQLDRKVAVKVLLSGYKTDEDLRRFRQEALATARLRHPHIVAIQSAGHSAGGHPYLVMDFIEGGSLADRLEEHGPLEGEEAARIVRDLAGALHYAHNRGILHRDLKPANILLDAENRPYLVDFGIAKILGKEERITLSGEAIGTPVYMAPEQAMARRDLIGPLTDVYGLGATMYEVLCGRPPFDADSVLSALDSVVVEPPKPPSFHRPGVDPVLDAICLRCLAKDPDERWPSARAMGRALERFLEPDEEPEVSSEPSRTVWFLGGVLLGVVLTGLLGAAAMLARTDSDQESGSSESAADETPGPAQPDPAELKRREAGSMMSVGLARLNSDRPTALWAFERAISLTPDDARAHANKARVLAIQQRLTEADEACQKAHALDPNCPELFVARGLIHMQRKEYQLSYRAYDRATQLAPDSATAWNGRGSALSAQGKEAEALADYRRATKLDPRHLHGWFNQGKIEHRNGRPREALPFYDRVVAIDPDFHRGWYNRGIAWLHLKEHQKAVDDFNKAAALNPLFVEVYVQRAQAHRGLKQRSGEIQDYSRALLLKPDYHQVWFNRALAKEQTQDLDGAVQDYGRAIELKPRYVGALLNRGQILHFQNELAPALADLKEGLQLLSRTDDRRARVQALVNKIEAQLNR